MFFDQHPEFIVGDPRKDRPNIRVTSESMSKRCAVMLPESLIKGKSVLDVGSAAGAMGCWCSENGANKYHGVEIQEGYRKVSNDLLSKYTNTKIWHYLGNTDDEYDIVVAAGVINGVSNQYEFIQKLCSKAKEYLIIEASYLNTEEALIKVFDGNMINYHDVNNPYRGVSFVPSIPALTIMAEINGFEFDERLYPEPILNSHDPYNNLQESHSRFIVRYKRSNSKVTSLEEAIHVGV